MSNLVYRKTESGKAEIGQRRAGLAPATRQLLILVNGTDNMQTLQAKGLGDVRSHLDTLLALQLIEPVPSVKAVALPAGNVVVPPPAASPPPPPPPLPEDQQRLLALQRRAYQTLQPHFGPDTPLVAQAMLAARSLTEFREALGGIEAKLAIYMGRKQAAREIDALRTAT